MGYAFYRVNSTFNEHIKFTLLYTYTDCNGTPHDSRMSFEFEEAGIQKTMGQHFVGKTFTNVRVVELRFIDREEAAAKQAEEQKKQEEAQKKQAEEQKKQAETQQQKQAEDQRTTVENNRKAEEQKQIERQRQIDAQMTIINQRDREMYAVSESISNGISSIFGTIQEALIKRRIDENNRERDKRFNELRAKVQEGNGELVDCIRCFGVGYEECWDCNSKGAKTCYMCNGNPKATCINCHGTGNLPLGTSSMVCVTCSGKGYKSCITCNNTGQTLCVPCNGLGKKHCIYCDGTGKEYKISSNAIQNNSQAKQKESIPISSDLGTPIDKNGSKNETDKQSENKKENNNPLGTPLK